MRRTKIGRIYYVVSLLVSPRNYLIEKSNKKDSLNISGNIIRNNSSLSFHFDPTSKSLLYNVYTCVYLGLIIKMTGDFSDSTSVIRVLRVHFLLTGYGVWSPMYGVSSNLNRSSNS